MACRAGLRILSKRPREALSSRTDSGLRSAYDKQKALALHDGAMPAGTFGRREGPEVLPSRAHRSDAPIPGSSTKRSRSRRRPAAGPRSPFSSTNCIRTARDAGRGTKVTNALLGLIRGVVPLRVLQSSIRSRYGAWARARGRIEPSRPAARVVHEVGAGLNGFPCVLLRTPGLAWTFDARAVE
jgi:hypothetical protein